jgi:rhodanese-related sulfurtransferase
MHCAQSLDLRVMKIGTITPLELAVRCGDGANIDLIDVRTPVEYREVHAVLARNVPLDQLDAPKVLQSRRAPASEPIYLICRSGSRGQKACQKFLDAGFPNVSNVEGGTLAWVACGLPVVRGKATISLERQVRIAAGSLVCMSAVLAWLVHIGFLTLACVIGAGLVFSGITDTCGMWLLLARMPWNRLGGKPDTCRAG